MNQVQMWFTELRDALHPQGLFPRVDVERCNTAVDRIEREFPEVVRQAERIVADKERILSAARSQAEEILKEAEAQVKRQISDSAIVKRAGQEADRIVSDAKREAERVVTEQSRLGAETLKSLSDYLDTLTVRTRDYAKRLK